MNGRLTSFAGGRGVADVRQAIPGHRDCAPNFIEHLATKDKLEGFIRQGMSDGSAVDCEPELVVQLLLGTLIWWAKWAPNSKNLTIGRLNAAIKPFAFHGLENR